MADWREVDIDDVPFGELIYDMQCVPLGIIVRHLENNGNSAPKVRRHLNNGQHKDRFAYRRQVLYRAAKKSGKVKIKMVGKNTQAQTEVTG